MTIMKETPQQISKFLNEWREKHVYPSPQAEKDHNMSKPVATPQTGESYVYNQSTKFEQSRQTVTNKPNERITEPLPHLDVPFPGHGVEQNTELKPLPLSDWQPRVGIVPKEIPVQQPVAVGTAA